MSIYPPATHQIKLAIASVKKAETRDRLGFHVKDAGNMIKRELHDSKQRMVKAMQTCIEEQKQLAAMMRELNEVTKAQIDKLPPKDS